MKPGELSGQSIFDFAHDGLACYAGAGDLEGVAAHVNVWADVLGGNIGVTDLF